ncbi:hypothetical protein, partial [Ruminococcus champanellensis]
MTENSSADATQSRQAGFVRYCLYVITCSAPVFDALRAADTQYKFTDVLGRQPRGRGAARLQ